MLQIIYFVMIFLILPVVYLLIIMFDINLIRHADSSRERLRMLAGAVVGLLFSVIFVELDLSTHLFNESLLPNPAKLDEVGPWVVIAVLVGFFIMLVLHLLLKTQAARGFIVLFTVFAVIVSAYFLLSSTVIRIVMAVTTIGFLAGVITYVIIKPEIIYIIASGGPLRQEKAKGEWSL